MRLWSKQHYIRYADMINLSIQTASNGKLELSKLTIEEKAQAFENLCTRINDSFAIDSDLYNEKKFKERAGI